MNAHRSSTVLALATLAILGIGLTGCSAGVASGSSADSTSTAATEEAASPADLTGEWKSADVEGSYQSATIAADSIEVNWVSDGGKTKALYWAGSYEAPSEAGDFTWDSKNDTEKTGAAILASSDPIKTFSYSGDVISYEVSAMGVTKTIELKRG